MEEKVYGATENTNRRRIIICAAFFIVGVLLGAWQTGGSGGETIAKLSAELAAFHYNESVINVIMRTLLSGAAWIVVFTLLSFFTLGWIVIPPLLSFLGLGIGAITGAAFSALGIGGGAEVAVYTVPGLLIMSAGCVTAADDCCDFSWKLLKTLSPGSSRAERPSLKSRAGFAIKSAAFIVGAAVADGLVCALRHSFGS